MHDPSFLAFELHSPIPSLDRWATRQARQGHRRPFIARRTNEANLGERVYPWWQLQGYTPRIGNWTFRFRRLIEGWHHEPGGGDAGTVCRDWHEHHRNQWRFAWKHRAHMRFRFMPWLRLRCNLERCHDCRRRFLGRARFGVSWDGPITICNECSRIRALRSQVADLAKYVRRECSETEQWRVERYWLTCEPDEGLVKAFADLGVGRSREARIERTTP